MKRKKREAILKERVTATLLIEGRDGKNKFVLCDITPLTEHIKYEGPQEIAKQLREVSYSLTKYSLSDLEEVGVGNGIYHLLVPGMLSTLKWLSDALDKIKEVQTV